MVDGNASMYLGSPRMAEMVIGEKVTPRGDGRRQDALLRLRLRRRARARARTRRSRSRKRYLALHAAELRASALRRPTPRPPQAGGRPLEEIIPADENKPFDMMAVIDAIVDEG